MEIANVCDAIQQLISEIKHTGETSIASKTMQLRGLFNQLFDVDKHYQRKEYLLFPHLEQKGITGPPTVMWGKHDEIRELIKGSIEALKVTDIDIEEFAAIAELLLLRAAKSAKEMINKEEEILFPMALDTLNEGEWYEISKQSLEIGYCLYDPDTAWRPQGVAQENINDMQKSGSHIQLPSGSFSAEEIMSLLNTLPVDITFVDKNDKVKYFRKVKIGFFNVTALF
ncbi:MAG: hemerythrin domain-containing protein [Paludibacteraceae bacterium]